MPNFSSKKIRFWSLIPQSSIKILLSENSISRGLTKSKLSFMKLSIFGNFFVFVIKIKNITMKFFFKIEVKNKFNYST